MRRRDCFGPLWAVSCYFNPMGWRRRLANYRVFRQHLSLPLVTVELGYLPHFELSAGDAEILISLRGRDILWQKERLLNLALQAVPPACEAVAWLDGDVIFSNKHWPELALRQLEFFALLQPFQDIMDLRRDERIEGLGSCRVDRRGLVSQVANGLLPPESVADLLAAYAPGLAWVARRQVLEEHGLYDAAIVGGGDRSILSAAYGKWSGLESTQRLNRRQLEHYLAWANPFFKCVLGNVGFVEGSIANLWHGDFKDRGYRTRFEDLAPFQFDPQKDIALDDAGCWSWNSAKLGLHEFVRRFFSLRKEDG